ncbi:MAG: HdeD family acid-resistance protein [Bilifractor sp.]|jgi:uncharacterized membrane protein HdeD (DUF308 family)
MIILGIFLVRDPKNVTIGVCIFLGVILLASGIVMLITYFINRGSRAEGFYASPVYCVGGAIIAALGAFIALEPKAIVNFATILFAVIILLHAVYGIAEASAMRNIGSDRWYYSIISSVIKIILALFIIAKPFHTAGVIVMIAGVTLILCGVTGMLQNVRVINSFRKYSKAARDMKQELSAVDSEIISEENADGKIVGK